MHEILDRTEGMAIGILVRDTLTASDFRAMRTYLQGKARKYGSLYLLFHMKDWRGWESIEALWEDLKTDVGLNKHVARLAMVGEEDWERWMTSIMKPFAKGKVRYFKEHELDEAWSWIREGILEERHG